MGDTWGVPGPVFLGVYVLLLLGAGLTAPLMLRALDRRAARDGGEASAPDVTVEDLALLAGGPARLVHAAIARLLEGGVLRVGRDRHLTSTGRPAIGELDEAVVDAVAATPAGATPTATVMRMRGAPVVGDLEAAARRRGLFHDPAAVARRKNIALAVIGVVGVLGLARLAAGIARSAPVVLLVVLLVLTVCVAFSVLLFATRRPTPKGRATLFAARSTLHRPAFATDRARGPVAAGTLGVAGLVAVGGFALYPDEELAGLLAAPTGGGGGGGGFVGGSSCSSGSSCGGGGGGCGG